MTRTHQLETTLRALRLSGMLETFEARLTQARAGDLGHVEFLQALCEDELSRRQAAGIARRLLERFGLTDAADRRADTYSGGMTRRLDIAMSLVGNPSVIFLDEPTTGLDPEGRLEVWATVKELAAAGATVLLTTQYLDEAEQLADRIAILHGGRIIADGTLAELKALFPPAQVEYVEKQPSLEEIFLAIIGKKEAA